MPFTDNNLNKEVLGETQTFAVADRSADALKARINRDNSQALRAKAARQRGSSPAVGPESVQGREASGPTVRPTDRPSVLDAIRAAGAVPAENRAVREQDPGSRGPVRANGYADEDDAKSDRMLRSQEDEPVRRSAPEKRTTSRPVQGTGERRQMAKTRTSDFKVDEVSRASSGKKKKEPEVVYESSDEGGNTVLSLIKAIVYIIFVLISAVALTMLASMISASTGMVKQSREKLDDYYTNNNGLVTRTGTSVSGFAEFGTEDGKVYDQVSYLENDESIGHAVIAYWKATS